MGEIFARKIFEKVKFPEGYWFEDTVMRLFIYSLYQQAATSSTILYRYRLNRNSITHTAKRSPKVVHSFLITEQLLRDREAFGLKNDASLQPVVLRQIKTNFIRVNSYGNEEINRCIFVLTMEMYLRYFKNCHNVPAIHSPIDRALRTGDYRAYRLACQLL